MKSSRNLPPHAPTMPAAPDVDRPGGYETGTEGTDETSGPERPPPPADRPETPEPGPEENEGARGAL
ncbi:hypothetical protein [Actinomadura sp. WMMA1423]|uniref:hypothetical protein n=1 Tax=Actinomadura sp. WMMA1423 TaxID=2591108 RepID=UPI0011467E08|nr:hypothetical protein [Actinomadura sp. WMMA1423]